MIVVLELLIAVVSALWLEGGSLSRANAVARRC